MMISIHKAVTVTVTITIVFTVVVVVVVAEDIIAVEYPLMMASRNIIFTLRRLALEVMLEVFVLADVIGKRHEEF